MHDYCRFAEASDLYQSACLCALLLCINCYARMMPSLYTAGLFLPHCGRILEWLSCSHKTNNCFIMVKL